MIDQQQLHHAVLGLFGHGGRVLRLDLHALTHDHRARSLRLRHGPHVSLAIGHRHVDQTLSAGADRVQQRVVAKARNLHADLLRSANHEGAFGHGHLDTVNGQRDLLDVIGDGRVVALVNGVAAGCG